MNQIELSIWGIRDGFEKGGMFHTHNLQGIKAKQTDKHRTLSYNVNDKGFYITQYIDNKFIVSFVETDISEYTPNGPGRAGYVVFSLIINNNQSFKQSPREFLNKLSKFYKSRVKEGNHNNFTAEEINAALASLTLVAADRKTIHEQTSAFAYYADSSKLDAYLSGNVPFAAYGEFTFIPTQELAPGQFKEVPFVDAATRSKLNFINLAEAEQSHQQKIADELEQKLIAERKQKELQRRANEAASEISQALKLGHIDDALSIYNRVENKSLIDPAVVKHLEDKKAAIDLRNKTKIESEKENDLIHQIFEAHRNRDLRTAAAYFEQLKIKENIPRNIQAEIHAYNAQIANKNEEERNQLLLLKAQQDKKKKLINNLAFVAAILIIIGGGFASFIYKTPSFLYGGPPTPPVHVDSLKQAFLNHKPIKASKINNFKNSFGTDYLKYTDQNEYRRAKNIQDLKNSESVIKDAKSIRLINVRFGLNVPAPNQPKPVPNPEEQQIDSLKENFINHENIKGILIVTNDNKHPFGQVWLKYTENNQYRKAENERDLKSDNSIIKESKEIQILNERFGLNVPVPGQATPQRPNNQPPTQNTNNNSRSTPPSNQQTNNSTTLQDFPAEKISRAKTLKSNILKTTDEADKASKINWAKEIKGIYNDYMNGVGTKHNELTKSKLKDLNDCLKTANTVNTN
jgi:hypothetical protein